VENMAMYVCPNCGNTDHIFGHGGVRAEAEARGLPFLGELPLATDVRLSGDSGTPIAAGEGPLAEAYARLADDLVKLGAVCVGSSRSRGAIFRDCTASAKPAPFSLRGQWLGIS